MKIIIFLLFVSVFGSSALAQKKLSVEEEMAYELKVLEDVEEEYAIVILASPYNLTFDSSMDKEVTVEKKELDENMFFYYLKFSTNRKHNGRKLKIKSDEYETLTYPLNLKSQDKLGLYVFDPYQAKVTLSNVLRNEGDGLFNSTEYQQAAEKYRQAIEKYDPQTDTPESKEILQVRIKKAQDCLSSLQAANKYFEASQWSKAYTEYNKVLGHNNLDTYCRTRLAICEKNRLDEPRTLTGLVKDDAGAILADATIIPGIDEFDKDGKYRKTNFPEKAAIKTDKNGRFKIETTYRTKKLQCYKGAMTADYYAPTMEIAVVDDEMTIVLRKGATLGSSKDKETESKSSTSKSSTSSSSTKSSTSKSVIPKKTF